MKVLLTGASGFLGRHVLDCLRSHGISTVVAGRSLPTNVAKADFVQVDLLDQTEFGDLISESRVTHLLHLAWYAEHGKYWSSPLNFRWTEATVRLVEAFCRSGGQKVVVAGTCAEYDWSYGYCREDVTPANPVTLYGIAKDATRRLTMAICAEHKIPCVWGRIFLPYGPGEDTRRLIPSLIDVFKGNRPPFGVNASAYRDFLHVADLAESFIHVLKKDTTGIYNLSSGRPVRIADVVRHIARSFNVNPDAILELSTERPGEPSFLVGDNCKLRSLDWKPVRSLPDVWGDIHIQRTDLRICSE